MKFFFKVVFLKLLISWYFPTEQFLEFFVIIMQRKTTKKDRRPPQGSGSVGQE